MYSASNISLFVKITLAAVSLYPWGLSWDRLVVTSYFCLGFVKFIKCTFYYSFITVKQVCLTIAYIYRVHYIGDKAAKRSQNKTR